MPDSPLKIAYFILAHAQAEQIARLVTQLDSANSHFYIHIDANTSSAVFESLRALLPSCAKVVFIERKACAWGGFSLVDASLRLIEAALKDGFDWGVLLSGQDYPIHSNTYINHFLAETQYKGFVEIKADFDIAYRYRTWHFERFNGKVLGKASQKIQRLTRKLGIERSLPAPIKQIYAGSQWWILRAEACAAVLAFSQENRRVVDFFRRTLVPDEMFFQTILMHTHLREQLAPYALRHLEWEDGAWSPRCFSPAEIPALAAQSALFARKFAADAATVDALKVLHSQAEAKN